jgi:hypothetical protein
VTALRVGLDLYLLQLARRNSAAGITVAVDAR